jgi:OOP family OmpA-OmpF porin
VLGPCGSASGLLGGAGFRVGITETIMLRLEGLATRAGDDGVMNVGGSAGVSVMLGSKPVTDADRDGVFDTDDRCPDTPLGTLTDERGCPSDSDSDGVFDGLDRCPATPAGARVNAAGCPEDADADNVPDGVDQCADTPAGAGVDARGCPQDSDDDGVSDGLDRCPDTPKGASVDQLGCPGDEDGDRVLDGLDRCPRTPAGAAVNTFGCPPGVPEGSSGTSFTPGSRRILPIAFARQSARLPDAAAPVLDSLATALVAQPNVTVEIASHGDGTTAETRHLTQLRADAVRRYLIAKGVSLQRVTARGYGSDQRLTGGTDAAAQTRNRRIELRVLPAAPGR